MLHCELAPAAPKTGGSPSNSCLCRAARAGSPLVAAGRACPRRALPLMGVSVPDLPRVGPAMAVSDLEALPLCPVPCSATRLLRPPPRPPVLLSSCSSACSPNEGGVVALCVLGALHLPDPPVGCRCLVASPAGGAAPVVLTGGSRRQGCLPASLPVGFARIWGRPSQRFLALLAVALRLLGGGCDRGLGEIHGRPAAAGRDSGDASRRFHLDGVVFIPGLVMFWVCSVEFYAW